MQQRFLVGFLPPLKFPVDSSATFVEVVLSCLPNGNDQIERNRRQAAHPLKRS